ncbi:MAG: hypothetical protein KDB53_11630 [Planctomycetes bacterium]|nr:hypothetical protein [Planctomycetota bacterium]
MQRWIGPEQDIQRTEVSGGVSRFGRPLAQARVWIYACLAQPDGDLTLFLPHGHVETNVEGEYQVTVPRADRNCARVFHGRANLTADGHE